MKQEDAAEEGGVKVGGEEKMGKGFCFDRRRKSFDDCAVNVEGMETDIKKQKIPEKSCTF